VLIAQPEIKLPLQIHLMINDSEIDITSDWVDSLVSEALSAKIKYQIVGASYIDKSITTQIQLPQFLSLNEVLRQIVIYYSLITEENDRQKEKLLIYPYFTAKESTPSLECRYVAGGEFNISVFKWDQVSIPDQPNVEQLEIFNKILQVSFSETSSFGGIPEESLEKFANRNNMSVEQVRQIYQNTILWQLSR
jgi:hypothetical protein